jgi:hypothetical protein
MEKNAFCSISYVVVSDPLVLGIFEFTTERACCRFDALNGLWTFLCCYLMICTTRESSMPLRGHEIDLIISVVYGISDAAIRSFGVLDSLMFH